MAAMRCERFLALIGGYVDGSLAAEMSLAMDVHRTVCASCREVLDGYERLPAVLRRATDVPMPPSAQRRLGRHLASVWRPRR